MRFKYFAVVISQDVWKKTIIFFRFQKGAAMAPMAPPGYVSVLNSPGKETAKIF